MDFFNVTVRLERLVCILAHSVIKKFFAIL